MLHNIDLRGIFECTLLKFTLSDRSKHTHMHVQCSHTNVGLAQARPSKLKVTSRNFWIICNIQLVRSLNLHVGTSYMQMYYSIQNLASNDFHAHLVYILLTYPCN